MASDTELKNLIKNKNTAAFISATALVLAAVVLWPYGYYILLRWIVSIAAFFTAYVANKLDKTDNPLWTWPFMLVGFLFNPIAPVYLDRETWQVIDIAVALAFLISIFKMKADE